MPKRSPTNRLNPRDTAPLLSGDLGLLASVVVLRGRKALEGRAPRALMLMERLAAWPVWREGMGLLREVIDKLTDLLRIVATAVSDVLGTVSRFFMTRWLAVTAKASTRLVAFSQRLLGKPPTRR